MISQMSVDRYVIFVLLVIYEKLDYMPREARLQTITKKKVRGKKWEKLNLFNRVEGPPGSPTAFCIIEISSIQIFNFYNEK